MLSVWDHMNKEGFICKEHSVGNRCVEPPFCPDVALIGCLSQDMMDIEGVVSELERNHGMLRGWDMLVYFINDKVPGKKVFDVMGRGSVISRYEFTNEAVRLLHAHLRRRYDVIVSRGAYLTIDRMLTESPDRVTPSSDKDTLGSKIHRAVDVLEKHLPDNDVSMVIKYLNLLLRMRNWDVHLGEHAFEKRKEAWDVVRAETVRRQYWIDRKHDPNRPKPETPDAQDFHDNMKDLLVLTHRIKDWLDTYAKTVGRP